MPLEEKVLPSESSAFTIRRFVSTVRGKDFSKCWPFSHRILERCLILGIKVELPPFEPSLNGHGRCNVSHGSSKEDLTNLDSKDSLKPSRDPAMEKVLCCDAEALNMAVEKVGASMRENFLATQKPNRAAEVEALTENLWDNNTVDCKPDIISKSASQIVVGKLPDTVGSKNLAGLYTASTRGTPCLGNDFVAAMKSDCGPYPAVQEGSCGNHKTRSRKPTVLCDKGIADSLQHSTFATTDHDVHHGDRESLKAFRKHAALLKESEPIGCLHKAERNKKTKDLGPFRSNSDTTIPKVCPVCLKFSSNSNTALNAHIDHCLIPDKADTARPFKKSFKLKKMRSMVDVYASAPVRTLKDLEMSSKIWSFQRAKQRFTRSGI